MHRQDTDTTLHVEDQLTVRSLSYHGVAMGISQDLAETMTVVEVGCKNVLAVELKVGDERILVFNIYLPTRSHDDDFETDEPNDDPDDP